MSASDKSSERKSTGSSRTEGVLRLRWNSAGSSKIISQKSVDDLTKLTKLSDAAEATYLTPDQVPFELTRSQTMSLMIPNKINKLHSSISSSLDKVMHVTRLSPIMSTFHRAKSGLNAEECFRDRYDGSLPASKTTYFTHWMTMIHVMVSVMSFSIFGFTQLGFGMSEQTGLVKMPYMKSESRSYYEANNPFIGPSEAHLVLLGARYPPCMRNTPPSKEENDSMLIELETACCVSLDGSGCYQSNEAQCDANMDSRWNKWSHITPGPQRRTYGSVCGLDPRFCAGHVEDFTNRWLPEITKWPVCKDTKTPDYLANKENELRESHMYCDIQARPCCYGIHKKCLMTTWEHCDLLRGTFHPNEFLCAQANCTVDLCGMSDDTPYIILQWHRFFSSLFVHQGLIDLMFSIWFQLHVMVRLENVLGFHVVPLFLGSGIFGNICGGFMAPNTVHCGPTAIHFGCLGCLQVLVYLKPPQRNAVTFLMPSVFLQVSILLLGLLPWVDLFGPLFGLVFGYLYSLAILIPKAAIFTVSKSQKCCIMLSVVLLVTMTTMISMAFFGITYIMDPIVSYSPILDNIDCIPITENFCKSVDPITGYGDKGNYNVNKTSQ